jgi:probable rRNA maturation factor
VSVEIANESGVSVDEAALAGLARHVLDEMRVHPLAELSLLLVDEPAMTELHVRWMGEEGPTDVLAFPMDELRPPQPGGSHVEPGGSEPSGIPGLLGDVVICPQVAAVQARRARHRVGDEIDLLCTHGILHLLGYDHADAQEHAAMFGLQDRLLASWRAEQGPDGGPAGSANGAAAAGRSGSPGAGSPGAGSPGAGLPGAGLPGAGLPGAGSSGAGSPGAGAAAGGQDDEQPAPG